MPEITKSIVFDFPKNTTVSTLYDGFENTVVDSSLWDEAGGTATKEAGTLGNFTAGSNRLTVSSSATPWSITSNAFPDGASAVFVMQATIGTGDTGGSKVTYGIGNGTDGFTLIDWEPWGTTTSGTGVTVTGIVFVMTNDDGTYSVYGPGGDSTGISLPNGLQLKVTALTNTVAFTFKMDEVRYAFP